MNAQLTEITRLLRNLIRIGVVSEVDTTKGMCRVTSGGLKTNWIHWLTSRAGHSRTWWAPSIGEQVLLLSIGGELTTAFVLPAIFSNEFPVPSTSPEATHIQFPDGAMMEYEPLSGALTVRHIKTAKIEALESIEIHAGKEIKLKAPKIGLEALVEIGLKAGVKIGMDSGLEFGVKAGREIGLKAGQGIGLKAGEIGLKAGELKMEGSAVELKAKKGEIEGDITHSGGTFKSNGVVVHTHTHPVPALGMSGTPL
ncbi:phage baseplate assembly protein V [Xenorhabdus koppenhoeferi]|nr:phage baseplate assembly protein V [Xenorhabdus koppenhoeferi]